MQLLAFLFSTWLCLWSLQNHVLADLATLNTAASCLPANCDGSSACIGLNLAKAADMCSIQESTVAFSFVYTVGSYPREQSWYIYTRTGTLLASRVQASTGISGIFSANAFDFPLLVTMEDTYGDGWSSGFLELSVKSQAIFKVTMPYGTYHQYTIPYSLSYMASPDTDTCGFQLFFTLSTAVYGSEAGIRVSTSSGKQIWYYPTGSFSSNSFFTSPAASLSNTDFPLKVIYYDTIGDGWDACGSLGCENIVVSLYWQRSPSNILLFSGGTSQFGYGSSFTFDIAFNDNWIQYCQPSCIVGTSLRFVPGANPNQVGFTVKTTGGNNLLVVNPGSLTNSIYQEYADVSYSDFPLSIVATDTGNNGWEGGVITLRVNGDIVLNGNDFTSGSSKTWVSSYSSSVCLVCAKATVTIIGGTMYSSENYYTLTTARGKTLLNILSGSIANNGVYNYGPFDLYTYDFPLTSVMKDTWGDGWNSGGRLIIKLSGITVLDTLFTGGYSRTDTVQRFCDIKKILSSGLYAIEVSLASPSPNLPCTVQATIDNQYGNLYTGINGNFMILSSGIARDTVGLPLSSSCTGNTTPAPFIFTKAHGNSLFTKTYCPPGKPDVFDSVNYAVWFKAPSNAVAFSYTFQFLSTDLIRCSDTNDLFLALLTCETCDNTHEAELGWPPSWDHNIAQKVYNGESLPVSVNLESIMTVCGSGTFCASSAGSLLDGSPYAGKVASGLLVNTANILPDHFYKLEFVIFDVSNTNLDSAVIIDEFRWLDTNVPGISTLEFRDECPLDPNKVLPGVCGCGVPDIDSDFDSFMDCVDACPNDPNKQAEGVCGCGVSDIYYNGYDPLCSNTKDCCSSGPITLCSVAEENSQVQLSCTANSVITNIVFASYGTPNGYCGSFTTSTCDATSSIKELTTRCLGKSSCIVNATNSIFGDPCQSTYKRLYVQYECEYVGSKYYSYYGSALSYNVRDIENVFSVTFESGVITKTNHWCTGSTDFQPCSTFGNGMKTYSPAAKDKLPLIRLNYGVSCSTTAGANGAFFPAADCSPASVDVIPNPASSVGFVSTNNPNAYGGSYLYTDTGSANSRVVHYNIPTEVISKPGYYYVSVHVVSPSFGSMTKLKYTIHSNHPDTLKTTSESIVYTPTAYHGWRTLGKYYFSDSTGTVSITNDEDLIINSKLMIVDDIRVTSFNPDCDSLSGTLLLNTVVDYAFYVRGNEVVTFEAVATASGSKLSMYVAANPTSSSWKSSFKDESTDGTAFVTARPTQATTFVVRLVMTNSGSLSSPFQLRKYTIHDAEVRWVSSREGLAFASGYYEYDYVRCTSTVPTFTASLQGMTRSSGEPGKSFRVFTDVVQHSSWRRSPFPSLMPYTQWPTTAHSTAYYINGVTGSPIAAFGTPTEFSSDTNSLSISATRPNSISISPTSLSTLTTGSEGYYMVGTVVTDTLTNSKSSIDILLNRRTVSFVAPSITFAHNGGYGATGIKVNEGCVVTIAAKASHGSIVAPLAFPHAIKKLVHPSDGEVSIHFTPVAGEVIRSIWKFAAFSGDNWAYEDIGVEVVPQETWCPTVDGKQCNGRGTCHCTTGCSCNPRWSPPSRCDTYENTPPVLLSAATITFEEDTVRSGTLEASDVNGDSVMFLTENISEPSFTIDLQPNGTYTLKPALNYYGTVTWNLQLMDSGDVPKSTPVTITINVTPIDDPPVVNPTTIIIPVNEDCGATTAHISATDVDSTLTYSLTSPSTLSATVSLNSATGVFSYTCGPNAFGKDVITFAVSDGVNGKVAGEFVVIISPINDAPTAQPVSLTMNEDSTLNGNLVGKDVENDPIKYSIQSQPTLGTVNLNVDTGAFTYTPNPNCNSFGPPCAVGTHTFTYYVKEASGSGLTSNVATVSITVNAVNDAPLVTNLNLATNEDNSVSGVLIATDIEGSAIIYAIPTPSEGKISNLNTSTGAFTYTPAANFFGTYEFSFTASDGLLTSTGNVKVTVTPVNDPPTFSLSTTSVSVAEDSGVFSQSNFLTNLSPGPSNEVSQTLTITTTVESGKASLFQVTPNIDSSGKLMFTPNANAVGSCLVTVTVKDSGGTTPGVDTTIATFTITITEVNDPPTFTEKTPITVNEDTTGVIVREFAAAISPGPPSESSQTISVYTRSSTCDSSGYFTSGPTLSSDGKVTFQLAPNAYGSCNIVVYFKDNGPSDGNNNNESVDKTITIDVNPINDAPSFVAGPSTISVDEDSGSYDQVWATSISNGAPNEAESVIFEVTFTSPGLFSSAPAINVATGKLLFTPAANQFGVSTIIVTLKEVGTSPVLQTSPVTIKLTITSVNDPPSFTLVTPTTYTFLEDSPISPFEVATNLSPGPVNENSQTLDFIVTHTCGGSLFSSAPSVTVVGTSGNLAFGLAADRFTVSPCTVSLVLRDSEGGLSSLQSITLSITNVNDAPIFTTDTSLIPLSQSLNANSVSIIWAKSISAGPFESDTVDFVLTRTSLTEPDLFAVDPAIDSAGKLTFTIAAVQYGVAKYSIYLQDNGGTGNGGKNQGSPVTLTISVGKAEFTMDFSMQNTLSVNEDSAPYLGKAFINNIDAADASFVPGLAMSVTVTSGADLFSTQPTVTLVMGSFNGSGKQGTADLAFALAANRFGKASITVTLSSEQGKTVSKGLEVTVAAVNDPPTFTISNSAITRLEDVGIVTMTNFLTGVSSGPYESDSLTASVSCLNNALFTVAGKPAIALSGGTGTLTFTTAANMNGNTACDVTLTDNGSPIGNTVKSFSVTITPVNDNPLFTIGSDIVVNEDAPGSLTYPNWATNLSPGGGPDEASQVLSFSVSPTTPSLFSVQPTIDSTGKLAFSLAANQFGSTTVSVYIQDNLGGKSASQTFTITVNSVNDPPTFTLSTTLITTSEDSGSNYVPNFVTASSVGPNNELVQSITWSFTVSSNDLFALDSSMNPRIQLNNGKELAYEIKPDVSGTATVTIRATDDGGTANGGVNWSSKTFTITVSARNDIPSFSLGSDITILEDSGKNTFTNWATNLNPGDPLETSQTLTFSTSAADPSLLSSLTIDGKTGTLVVTPAADKFGSTVVTIHVCDDGPGNVCSPSSTFLVTVTGVNDAPNFTHLSGHTSLEDVGSISLPDFITGVDLGPNESSQSVNRYVVTNNNPQLFSVAPAISTSGVLTYTAAPDAFGTATIFITLIDNGGQSNGGKDDSAVKTATITVTGVNDPPSFVGVPVTVSEDTTSPVTKVIANDLSKGPANEASQAFLSFPVTANDCVSKNLFIANPTINTNGRISFTLVANAYGSCSVTFYASDDGGVANGGVDSSAPQSVTITITPVNDPPTFTPGKTSFTYNEDQGVITEDWATNISTGGTGETENLIFTVTVASSESLFTATPTVSATTGKLSFTLANNAFGAATLSVVLAEEGTAELYKTAPVVVTITVNAVNDPPYFTQDRSNIELYEDSLFSDTIVISGISPGAPNEASQVVIFTVTHNCGSSLFSAPPTVSVVNGNKGQMSFALAENQNTGSGSCDLLVTAKDNGGGSDTSSTATIRLTVTPVNDPPSYIPNFNTRSFEQSLTNIDFSITYASNISPGPNESSQSVSFTVAVVEQTNSNLLVNPVAVSPVGLMTFRVRAHEFGSTTLSITLCDNGKTNYGGKDCATPRTFFISVANSTFPPIFTSGPTVNVDEDTLSVSIVDWITDIDARDDIYVSTLAFTLTVEIGASLFAVPPEIVISTSSFVNGASGKGTLTFVPAPDQFGIATIRPTLSSSGGATTGDLFTININGVNDPPSFVLNYPTFNVGEDAPTVTINNFVGSVIPGPGGEGVVDSQTVSAVTVTCDVPTLFSSQPTVTLNGSNGKLMFTLAADKNGKTTCGVSAKDSLNLSSPVQNMEIIVAAVNDPPTFNIPPTYTINEDSSTTSVSGFATAISAGPADESEQGLAFAVSVTNEALFSVLPTMTSTGTLNFALAPNAFGSTMVTVTLTDQPSVGVGLSLSKTFTFIINEVNDAPTFNILTTTVTRLEDSGHSTIADFVSGVSAGPFESQTLTMTISTSTPEYFAVNELSEPLLDIGLETRMLSFTLKPDVSGTASVTITLKDNGGVANGGEDTTSKSFSIIITQVNDVPSFIKGASVSFLEDSGAKTYNNWATSISPGDPLESSQSLHFELVVEVPTLFTSISLSSSGTLQITPAPNWYGVSSVTVRICDDHATDPKCSAYQEFSVTITNVNDAPTALVGSNIHVFEDSSQSTVNNFVTNFNPGPNESDDILEILVVAATPSMFAVQPAITPAGKLTFILMPNAFGSSQITITVKDDGGVANDGVDSYVATRNIIIHPVNDPPSFVPSGDIQVAEDATSPVNRVFATSASPGPLNEASQTLTFSLLDSTCVSLGLFTVLPVFSSDLTVRFSLVPNKFGSCTARIVVSDDGGDDNGGVFQGMPTIITFVVNPVNDPPSFTPLFTSTAVNEDENNGNVVSIPWAASISSGPFEADEVQFFVSTTSPLFNGVPTVNAATGDLEFRLASNENGVGILNIYLKETSTVELLQSSTVSVTINVNPVNDPPTFVLDKTSLQFFEDATITPVKIATSLFPGPANEIGQTLSFLVFHTCNTNLFAVAPTVDIHGAEADISFVLSNNQNTGASPCTVSLTLKDSLDGTSAPQSFTLTITPVNDAPSFAPGSQQISLNQAVSNSPYNAIWATAISPGPFESSQAGGLQFFVTQVSLSNSNLFHVPVAISPSGMLTFSIAALEYGTARFNVYLKDAAGTANGGVDTSATVSLEIAVGKSAFQLDFSMPESVTVLEDSLAYSNPSFVTDIDMTSLTFVAGASLTAAVTSGSSLFSVPPAFVIDTASFNSEGDGGKASLTFTPASNAFGKASVLVTLSNTQGDIFSRTLTIDVDPVNDPPTFTASTLSITRNEDIGSAVVPSFATSVSAGAGNEAELDSQTVAFLVSCTNAATLFSAVPTIAVEGNVGHLSFATKADAYGVSQCTIVLEDNKGGKSPSVILNIEIVSVNDPPYFTPGLSPVVVPEDSPLAASTFNWATGISTGAANEVQTLEFTVAATDTSLFSTQPSITSTGKLSFVVASDRYGSTSVSITLSDGLVSTPATSFTIVITPLNDPPSFSISSTSETYQEDSGKHTIENFFSDISAGPYEDNQVVTFSFSTNNDALFAKNFNDDLVISKVNKDLSFTFLPDISGTAVITITCVDDGGSGSGSFNNFSRTFTVILQAVNDVPYFTIGSPRSVLEDSTNNVVEGWITEISAGDPLETDQSVNFVVTFDEDKIQSATISAAGSLTLTPYSNAFGTTTLSVKICDSLNLCSTTQSQTITIIFVNDVPSFALDQSLVEVIEDSGAANIAVASNLFAGVNEEFQTMQFLVSITSQSDSDMLSTGPSINTSGFLSFTPRTDKFGTVTLSVRLRDNGGVTNGGKDTTDPVTITIQIIPKNDPPSFSLVDPIIRINEDAGLQNIATFTAMIPGPENESEQTLQFSITSNSNTASFHTLPSINLIGGILTFRMADNFNGKVTLTVVLQDNGGVDNGGKDTSSEVVVEIEVTSVNDLPVGVADSATVQEDVPATINVLANDYDVDLDTLMISSVSATAQGATVEIINGGTAIRYTSKLNYNGPDSFTYVITDNQCGSCFSSPTMVTVTVAPVDDVPVALASTIEAVEDVALELDALTNLNYEEVDGDPVTFQIASGATNGQASFTNGKTLHYLGKANYCGTDTFTFKAFDGKTASNAALVTVKIACIADPPTVTHISDTFAESTGNLITKVYTVVASDPDAGETASIQWRCSDGPTLGNVDYVVDTNYPISKKITYQPIPWRNGVETLHCSVTSVDGFTVPFTITLTITGPANHIPDILQSESLIQATEDVNGVGSLSAVEYDEGDTLTYFLVSGPTLSHCQINLNSTIGVFNYILVANAVGDCVFTWNVHDSEGATAIAAGKVTIRIHAVPDVPVVTNMTFSAVEDVQISSLSLSATDVDIANEGDSLVFALLTNPFSCVTITNSATGKFRFLSTPNFNGEYVFQFLVRDSYGLTASAYATIHVVPVNDPPTAAPLAVTIDEDSTVLIELPGSDIDTASSLLVFSLQTPPSSGLVTGFPKHNVTYTPKANFFGTDQFAYTVSDGEYQATNLITITISAINDPPVALSTTWTVPSNSFLINTLSISDVDTPLDSLELIVLQNTTLGTMTLIDLVHVEYTTHVNSDPNFTGTDYFIFIVSDGETISNNVTITIEIMPSTNVPPVVSNIVQTTMEDTVFTNFLTATDPDSETVTFEIVSPPSIGMIMQFNPSTGNFQYIPVANFHGDVTFSFRAKDEVFFSAAATYTIRFLPVNDLPVCQNINLEVDEDNIVTGVASCVDVDNDLLTYEFRNGGEGSLGKVQFTTAPTFIYTPRPDAFGIDTIRYVAHDGSSSSPPTTIRITIRPVNDAPIGVDQNLQTPEDVTLYGKLQSIDVDSDPSKRSYSLGILTGMSGTVSLTNETSGDFQYIPAPNFNGVENFQFFVSDGELTSAMATVTITVQPVNDPPTANSFPVNVNEDEVSTILLQGHDLENDPLTYSLPSFTTTAGGKLVLVNSVTGEVSYTPPANYFGPDSFRFLVSDGSYVSAAPGTVSISVQNVNDPPVVSEGVYSLVVGFNTLITVVAMDIDSTLDSLQISDISTPVHGSFRLVPDPPLSFLYEADKNTVGLDSITVTITDGISSSSAVIAIFVRSAVSIPAVALDLVSFGMEDVPLDGSLQAVPFTAPIQSFIIVPNSISPPGAATFSNSGVIGANGVFKLVPAANFHGTVTFSFQALDGDLGLSNVARATIKFASVDDVPVAVGNTYYMDEDSKDNVIQLVATDIDTPAANIRYYMYDDVNLHSHEYSLAVETGKLTFSPKANYFGPVVFQFFATDDASESNPATVTIVVLPQNDPPVALSMSFKVLEDDFYIGKVSGKDVDGDSLTFALVGSPSRGSISFNEDGTFTYFPNVNQDTDATFVFVAKDGQSQSQPTMVFIDVIPVNDIPVATATSSSFMEGSENNFGQLIAYDVEDATLTYLLVDPPTNGYLELDLDGKFYYTPNEFFYGTDVFTFIAVDSEGATTNITSHTIDIINVINIPMAVPVNYPLLEDSEYTGRLDGIDYDGRSLSFNVRVLPKRGHFQLLNDTTGEFFYKPHPDYNGLDLIGFAVSDGLLDSSVAVSLLVIESVNDAPLAQPLSLEAEAGVALVHNFPVTDVDHENTDLTFEIIENPRAGKLTIQADRFIYVGDKDAILTEISDSFRFRAVDPEGGISQTVTVSLLVAPNADTILQNSNAAANGASLISGLVVGIVLALCLAFLVFFIHRRYKKMKEDAARRRKQDLLDMDILDNPLYVALDRNTNNEDQEDLTGLNSRFEASFKNPLLKQQTAAAAGTSKGDEIDYTEMDSMDDSDDEEEEEETTAANNNNQDGDDESEYEYEEIEVTDDEEEGGIGGDHPATPAEIEAQEQMFYRNGILAGDSSGSASKFFTVS